MIDNLNTAAKEPEVGSTTGTKLWIVFLSTLFFVATLWNGSSGVISDALITSWLLIGTFAWFLTHTATLNAKLPPFMLPLIILVLYSLCRGLLTLIYGSPLAPDSHILSILSFSPIGEFWFSVKAVLLISVFLVCIRIARIQFLQNLFSFVFIINLFAILSLILFAIHVMNPELGATGTNLNPLGGFGTFPNKNHFAFSMVLLFGFQAAFVLKSELSNRSRLVLVLMLPPILTAVILAGSRGAILSIIVQFGYLAFTSGSKKKSRRSKSPSSKSLGISYLFVRFSIFIVVSGIFCFAVLLLADSNALTKIFNYGVEFRQIATSGGYTRLEVYRASMDLISGSPVFGQGFGGFEYSITRYLNTSGSTRPSAAHNEYLELVIAVGLVGAGLIIWSLTSFFKSVRQTIVGRNWDPFKYAALCAVIGALIHSFFDYSLQFLPNQLFFVVLLAALYRSSSNETTPAESGSLLKQFVSPLLAASIVFSLFYTSSLISQLPTTQSIIGPRAFILPFDGKSHKLMASYSRSDGKRDQEKFLLQNSLPFSRSDYDLWLALARIELDEGNLTQAQEHLEKAIALAPSFSEPSTELGLLRIRIGELDEGFGLLRKSFRYNPDFFDAAKHLAWEVTGIDAKESLRLLKPTSAQQKIRFQNFVFREGEYRSLTNLMCLDKDLKPENRLDMASRLLKKNQIHFAAMTMTKRCHANFDRPIFSNGDFEKKVAEDGSGFGWDLVELPKTIKALIADSDVQNSRVLQIEFSGRSKRSQKIFSQIIPASGSSAFEISFKMSSDKLIGEGLPVIDIYTIGPDSRRRVSRIKSERNQAWITSRTRVVTEVMDEGIEISVKRGNCSRAQCPLFGTFMLDDFQIKPADAQK